MKYVVKQHGRCPNEFLHEPTAWAEGPLTMAPIMPMVEEYRVDFHYAVSFAIDYAHPQRGHVVPMEVENALRRLEQNIFGELRAALSALEHAIRFGSQSKALELVKTAQDKCRVSMERA